MRSIVMSALLYCMLVKAGNPIMIDERKTVGAIMERKEKKGRRHGQGLWYTWIYKYTIYTYIIIYINMFHFYIHKKKRNFYGVKLTLEAKIVARVKKASPKEERGANIKKSTMKAHLK